MLDYEGNLFNKIMKIQSDPSLYDFGGGSPLDKCYVMAYLAVNLNLKNYVEIGVYRGRSLFSMAEAFKLTNGKAYGIDPYNSLEAQQFDTREDLREDVNSFMNNLDLEQVYKDVIIKRELLDLTNVIELIRKTSAKAVSDFENIEIDMLHIDGNHDTLHVQEDYTNYAPLIKDGGLIVFDDINWDSVKKCYEEAKKDHITLLETDYFGILMKTDKNQKNIDFTKGLATKLKNLHSKLCEIENQKKTELTVAVGVLTFNHEEYIVQCLDSIVNQKGSFHLKLIICEDKSTDRTAEIIEQYITESTSIIDKNITIEYLTTEENLGMVKNLQRLLEACQGNDYVALIDGDDYWTNESKLQRHIDYMRAHPECALTFDSILMYWEQEDKFELYSLQQEAKKTIFNTSDIIENYVIGNISCCVYDGRYLAQIPTHLFEMFVGDWMLNIVYSQFGDIGFIKHPMTVYRKHKNGIWSGINEFDKRKKLIDSVHDYNRFLNYMYDEEFSKVINLLSYKADDKYLENYDVVIIDDIFPHPVSGFRYQEFISYLQHMNSLKVLTTGWSVHVLGKQTIHELMISFKRKFPDLGNRLMKFTSLDHIDCKLLYFVFLGNAYSLVELAEAKRIPFVFTLYPGGLFGLNNANSDDMLRRVMKSPCFRKVIVSQKAIRDYLIEKEFCKPEQIEYIFGVVTPLDKIESSYQGKKHFGIDKENLDICFVAHKYTKYGQDKGYDVFIETAKILAKKYNNVNFHVVGNFDESVIDISTIRDKVHFYGIRQPEWFDEFYRDKDIILSANINGMIYKGSFDGFPTASCTDAGLCKTAIFCTDPLNLNNGHFKQDEELVIIEHNVSKIVEKIDFYYNHPELLKNIGENGYLAIKKIYGYESQIKPRIQLLQDELAKPFYVDEEAFKHLYKISLKRRVYNKLKQICPQPVKDVIKRILNR